MVWLNLEQHIFAHYLKGRGPGKKNDQTWGKSPNREGGWSAPHDPINSLTYTLQPKKEERKMFSDGFIYPFNIQKVSY